MFSDLPLFRDRFHLTSGHSLNIHLAQSAHQNPFTAHPLFKRGGIKATFSHLGYGKGNVADSGSDDLGLYPFAWPMRSPVRSYSSASRYLALSACIAELIRTRSSSGTASSPFLQDLLKRYNHFGESFCSPYLVWSP